MVGSSEPWGQDQACVYSPYYNSFKKTHLEVEEAIVLFPSITMGNKVEGTYNPCRPNYMEEFEFVVNLSKISLLQLIGGP